LTLGDLEGGVSSIPTSILILFFFLFVIPVIIISTLTGTANFAQDKITDQGKRNIFVMVTGGLNIFAAIVTTIGQFLKVSEMNEGHRVASYSWGKYYRHIKTELAKHPLDRINPADMISMAKEEYDRLLELSPMIPKKIIQEFNQGGRLSWVG
jgi:hypothetical protein